jgi:energy-converting hydrogenase Eha subunit C
VNETNPLTSRRFRRFQTIAYALLGLAGAILMADPTRSIEGQALLIRVILSGFLVIGALVTVIGVSRDLWMVEFVGLPLLWSSVAAFVVILVNTGSTGALAVACFFGAIAVILFRRFLDLWDLLTGVKRAKRGGYL